MADPIATWLSNFLSTTRLLNTKGGMIWLISGVASTLAVNFAADPPPVHFWYHPYLTLLSIFGATVVVVNVVASLAGSIAGAVGLRNYKRKASKTALKNLESITMEEAQALLWLFKTNRRFTANSRNRVLLDMQMKNFVHEAKWEDGVYSVDTYVVDPEIWKRRDKLTMRFANVKQLKTFPFATSSWMVV